MRTRIALTAKEFRFLAAVRRQAAAGAHFRSRYNKPMYEFPYLWVALGSAAGGCLRFALGRWILVAAGDDFPYGTLAINLLGSFLIGLFATRLTSVPLRELLMVGLCGGFTTFSSFSLETLRLLQRGLPARAALYVGLSVALCLAGTWAAHQIGERIR
jgi:CrcB protein